MTTIAEARDRPTLTVRETAGLVRMGLRQTYDAVHRGEIPSVRIGRRILIPTAPLLAMLSSPAEPPARARGISVVQLAQRRLGYNAEVPTWQGGHSTTTTRAAVTKPVDQASSPSVGPTVTPCHASRVAGGA